MKKTASPFPLRYTIKGRISITDFHGGTMPYMLYEPLGYKNTANGLCLRFNTALNECNAMAKVVHFFHFAK